MFQKCKYLRCHMSYWIWLWSLWSQRTSSKILDSVHLAQKAIPILLIPSLKDSKTYINSLINTFFEWFRKLSISSKTDTVCSKMPSCQLSSLLPLHFLKWTWFFNSFHVEYFYVLFFSNFYLVNLHHSSYVIVIPWVVCLCVEIIHEL